MKERLLSNIATFLTSVWHCSLGVVLWELITLKRPWDNTEAEEPGSLDDAWIPELDSANDQPLVQQQRITEYAIIQVLLFTVLAYTFSADSPI